MSREIDKRLRELGRERGGEAFTYGMLCLLRDAARIGAEVEREECDTAAASAGDAGDTAFERGAKIRNAIRARGGK